MKADNSERTRMARSKNPELQSSLEQALYESLCSNGLDGTSYQLLADRVGISRALVQHYYPKKIDFAMGFLKRVMAAACEILGIESYAKGDPIGYLDTYRASCLYYSYLLDEDGARPLLFSILKDRELTDELMHQHYEWGLQFTNPSLPSYELRSQDLIEAWGGFYELMYFSIKQGFELDVPMRVLHLLDDFIDNQDGVSGLTAESFLDERPTPGQLDELKALLGEWFSANEETSERSLSLA